MRSSTSAAKRRNSTASWWALCKVRARIGTSSIERALIKGAVTPGGIRSKFCCSFWLSRTSAVSTSCPTRKRTITMLEPGVEVL